MGKSVIERRKKKDSCGLSLNEEPETKQSEREELLDLKESPSFPYARWEKERESAWQCWVSHVFEGIYMYAICIYLSKTGFVYMTKLTLGEKKYYFSRNKFLKAKY